ncbi:hypothetical protein FOMPIDRAFT_1133265 [Fomitopsis schrenkii]|uniref:Ubiquitin-like protease family profile domain-containing protein n=1 Tax=Fomitopsis schrenkii TaxID=2126942 RepID=S8EZH7_FOMSC|nr:hypothetical protein FOMPIDRAFT_1133265 [Fomitopsis schrenkii]
MLSGWLRAENWLLLLRPLGAIVADTRLLLSRIPWHARIRGLESEPYTHFLATYLSRNWMASDHINAYLEVVQDKIVASPQYQRDRCRVQICHTYFTQILDSHYEEAQRQKGGIVPSDCVLPEWMLVDRDAHTAGHLSSLGLVFNLNNRHWVSVVIELDTHTILYGDSLKAEMPSDLAAKLHWWLRLFSPTTFDTRPLPCTTQALMDTYSCGLLSSNAVAHHYFAEEYPLIPSSGVDTGRMQILRQIWEYSKKKGSSGAHSTSKIWLSLLW